MLAEERKARVQRGKEEKDEKWRERNGGAESPTATQRLEGGLLLVVGRSWLLRSGPEAHRAVIASNVGLRQVVGSFPPSGRRAKSQPGRAVRVAEHFCKEP